MDIRRRFWQWKYEEPHVQRCPLGKMPDSELNVRSIYWYIYLTSETGQADEHDVIVVSLNYRLNIFGFPRAPFLDDKNLGLLDQRMATVWVRDK